MITYQNSGQFGDLKSFEVKINDKEITESVLSCFVFQDMFSPTNTASIVVNDTSNLLLSVPIKAGSKISIKYETEHGSDNDGEVEWEMEIYRVGEKDVQNSKVQSYTIFAAHASFFQNQTKKLQKSFKDKKVSDIVKEIAGQLGGSVDVEKTEGNVSVLIPNWTPFYAINWCSKFAIQKGAADYVFFQDFEDKWIFKPFEWLYDSDDNSCDITFTIAPTAIVDKTGQKNDYTTIVSKYHFEHYDALTNLAAGYYRSKLLTYDFIEKEFDTHTFTFGQDCPKDAEKLQVDNSVLGAEDSNISFLPLHPEMNDAGATYLDNSKEWHGSHKSSMMKFEQEKIIMQFPGSGKAREWFGKNCEFDLPTQIGVDEEEFDKTRRGKYLITSMAHMLTGGTYTINAEMVKKRFEENPDE